MNDITGKPINDVEWSASERAILSSRSQALAAPTAREEHSTVIDAVYFAVAGERYAVESAVVHGVAALVRLAPLPHAPPEVAGLVSRAGLVLPLFHLRAVLALPPAPLGEHSRVIFLGNGLVGNGLGNGSNPNPEHGPELGLVVDAVETVHAVDIASVCPVPADVSAGARTFARGLTPDGVLLLDGAALLASDSLYVDIPFPT